MARRPRLPASLYGRGNIAWSRNRGCGIDDGDRTGPARTCFCSDAADRI